MKIAGVKQNPIRSFTIAAKRGLYVAQIQFSLSFVIKRRKQTFIDFVFFQSLFLTNAVALYIADCYVRKLEEFQNERKMHSAIRYSLRMSGRASSERVVGVDLNTSI